MEKNVIQVYITNHYEKVKNIDAIKDKYFGFGDLIRGTISLYLLSKKLNYNFYVDTHLHPISKYLEPIFCPYITYIDENINKIPYVGGNHNVSTHNSFTNFFNFVKSSQNIIAVFSNDVSANNMIITNDCKEFCKLFLQPQPFFLTQINSFIDNLPLKNYNVFQFRMGDDEVVYNKDINIDYNKFFNKFISKNLFNPKEDIIISDSKKLKDYAKSKGYNTTQFNPKHFGVHNDEKSTQELLLEIFMMSKAKKIKSYTVYSWTSGFTYWISKIYDIPYEKIVL